MYPNPYALASFNAAQAAQAAYGPFLPHPNAQRPPRPRGNQNHRGNNGPVVHPRYNNNRANIRPNRPTTRNNTTNNNSNNNNRNNRGRSSTRGGPRNQNFSTSRKRSASSPPRKQNKKIRDDMNDDPSNVQGSSKSSFNLKDCIIILGKLHYLPSFQEIKDFNDAISVKISDKVFTINCSSYDFKLGDVKEGYQVKACCIKFGDDWFNDLSKEIKKGQENNTLGHVDLYQAVHDCVDQQVKKVQNHFKPKGPIFLIVTCGSDTDAIVATYGMLNNHPLIQLDEDGKRKFADLGNDPKKIARHFAYKIGDKLCQFANMTKTTNLGAAVTADRIIDPDSI